MCDAENTVTAMLSRLKGGDDQAAAEIWGLFIGRVSALAKARLGSLPQRVCDEEDVALSAMNALYVGVREGRFAVLNDRDDLWQVLCMLTSRKAANAWRKYAPKGSGLGNGHADDQAMDAQMLGLQHIAQGAPDVGYLDSLSLQCRERLEGLDERLREVAILRLHGYSNQEIADKIGRSIKSVERYVKSIREEWLENG